MGHTDFIGDDGEKWPSVTEIVAVLNKEFLAYWRGKIGNAEADRISKESAIRGRKLHEMVETYLRDGHVDTCGLSEDIKNVFNAWHEWWQSSAYVVTALEQKVISKKHKFHGTFDGVLTDTIVDWKFSNSEDHYRILQLAGYAQAYFEQTGQKIKKGLIVQIDKAGEVHETHVPDLWKYVPLFVMLRKLWDFCKKKGRYKTARQKK